jgi:predicted nucleic acid-binding protein
MIDSQIFVWGIKGQASESQEHRIEEARNFIDWLSSNDFKILLPTPLMAELLSAVPKSEQGPIKSLFDKSFIIAPFDAIAAEKCGELINLCLKDEKNIEYKKVHSVPRNEIKFDCMLIAIAITRMAKKVYSNDPHLKKFANGQIEVLDMPIVPVQQKLF